MKSSFTIRRYKENDKAGCRGLWREHPEENFDKHLGKVGPEALWVAVHDSKIVGLIGLILKGREAEIEPLIVSKPYRGKGIGKQLIQTVIAEARSKRVAILIIGPAAQNKKAIKFLYKQGFKNLGYIELFMDLSNRPWKPGPEIFGCKFNF